MFPKDLLDKAARALTPPRPPCAIRDGGDLPPPASFRAVSRPLSGASKVFERGFVLYQTRQRRRGWVSPKKSRAPTARSAPKSRRASPKAR